jgi:hypothetical protein
MILSLRWIPSSLDKAYSILAGYESGTVCVWKLGQERKPPVLHSRIQLFSNPTELVPVTAVAVDPKGVIGVAGTAGSTLFVFELNPKVSKRFVCGNEVVFSGLNFHCNAVGSLAPNCISN